MRARRRAFRRRGLRQESSRASWGWGFYVSLPWGGLLRQPDQGSHALARLVAAVGEKTFAVRVSTEPAAMDLRYAELREALSRHRIEVEQPVARAFQGEGNFRRGVRIETR